MSPATSTAGMPAERQAERRPQVVALGAHEPHAAAGIRNAHEPIMIGKRRLVVHAEQRDQDHAGRVEPDPDRHQRAEDEVAGDADRELRSRRADRVAAPGMTWVRRATMTAAATNSSTPMPSWMRRCGQRATKPGAQPRARHGGRDHQHQRRHVDLDDRDEDERLGERRHRVADVQRPGDVLVVDDRPSL